MGDAAGGVPRFVSAAGFHEAALIPQAARVSPTSITSGGLYRGFQSDLILGVGRVIPQQLAKLAIAVLLVAFYPAVYVQPGSVMS